jgi:prepilin-type N-terminal cleavage/methylation domain-containing protein
MKSNAPLKSGFTLVEMALVLLILGVLTRAAVVPFAAAREHRQYRLAAAQLESIRSAVWAHVVSRGALPCPTLLNESWHDGFMLPTAAGDQSQTSAQNEQAECSTFHGGVPARQLGLPGAIDGQGALLDPWNRAFRLAVSAANHRARGDTALSDWTTPGDASRIGIAELEADLVLCSRSAGEHCPAAEVRAHQLAFVVLTTGPDDSATGAQAENVDDDKVFVLREASVQAEKPFDDQLAWGTSAETVYWMLRAGWLP